MANRFHHWRISLFAVLALMPAFAASAPQRGILYECRMPSLAPSYLMGTMHSSDPRVLALVADAAGRLQNSQRLVLEMVPDGLSMTAIMLAGMLPRGEALDTLLEPGLVDEVLQVAGERGLPREVVLRMKPWALATSLSLPPGETGLFLDLRLYHLAQEKGLEILGLETAAEQLALFDHLPAPDQVALLEQAVKMQPALPLQFDEMVAAYVAGDLRALERLSGQQQHELGPRLGAWFQQELVDARNRRMAERLGPILARGGAFVAVGALHLPGDTGLLARLEAAGCALSALR
jgi:uncharacterized protein YbaP (TraB family)